MHPRAGLRADLARQVHPLLGWLPAPLSERLLPVLPVRRVPGGTLRDAARPQAPAGHLIGLPLSEAQLRQAGGPGAARARAQARLAAALDQARALGGGVVGLGGRLPGLPGAAELAAGRGLRVTDGRAYTAAMLLRAARRLRAWCPGAAAGLTVALVGAGTPLGAAVARLLARHGAADQLPLLGVGGPDQALQRLASELRPQLRVQTGGDLRDLPGADLVLLLDPAGSGVPAGVWKEGAVVLNAGCAPGARPGLRRERPDVMVVDAPLVELPGLLGSAGLGLPPGLACPALAETLLLSLAGHRPDPSANPAADLAGAAEALLALARQHAAHGFGLAPLRCFGAPITPETFAPVLAVGL